MPELQARGSVSYETDRRKPTSAQYEAFERACRHLNDRLFEGQLPPAILVFNRTAASASFFSADRWYARDDSRQLVSEISLNPDMLKRLTERKIAATLVHELAHLWQHAFGQKKSRDGYHNMEWSQRMESVGLMPSDTGRRGGVRVGQKVSQWIVRGGPFESAFASMPRTWLLPFLSGEAEEKKTDRSKTKLVCPGCGDAVWGKRKVALQCVKHEKPLALELED